MTFIDVGFMLRKLGNSLSPSVEITLDGDVYTLKTTSTFKTTEIKFKLGEEFEEERLDGTKVKSVVTLDGNKMTHVMKGDPESTIVREFNDNDMTAVIQFYN